MYFRKYPQFSTFPLNKFKNSACQKQRISKKIHFIRKYRSCLKSLTSGLWNYMDNIQQKKEKKSSMEGDILYKISGGINLRRLILLVLLLILKTNLTILLSTTKVMSQKLLEITTYIYMRKKSTLWKITFFSTCLIFI